jgi:glycerol uptake facilitator protein
VTDDRNLAPPPAIQPIVIGMVVVLVGIGFGGLHGYAINPARDLGPRVFITLVGFKNNGLTDGTGVFWVPLVGPIIGGLLGTAAYEFGIRRYLPAAKAAAAAAA